MFLINILKNALIYLYLENNFFLEVIYIYAG